MSAVFTNVVLAEGQIPATLSALYTATSSVLVKGIQLGNPGPATMTIRLYRLSGADSRFWRRVQLRQFETADLIEGGESMKLDTGDAIQATDGVGATVDYTIDGVTIV